jgi:hypothetical protein
LPALEFVVCYAAICRPATQWIKNKGDIKNERKVAEMTVLRRLILCVVICAGAVMTMAPVAALSDEGAITAYLHAADSFAREQASAQDASIAAIEVEGAQITHGCPSVLVGAPHNKQLAAIAEEVSAAVLFSGVAPDRRATLAFARRISALHFRDPKIASAVRSLAREERGAAKLVIPDVCADAKAWVASAHRTLAPQTVSFLKQVNVVTRGSGPKEESFSQVLARLLATNESGADQRIARHTKQLEETTGKKVLRAFGKVMETVGRALGSK